MSRRVVFGAVLAAGCALRSPVWEGRSPGGETIVTMTQRAGRNCVYVNGRLDACHDSVGATSVAIAGEHWAYPALAGNRWVMVYDGRPGEPWDGVGLPMLSSSGRHFAYAAQRDGRWRVVRDGEAGAPFDAVLAHSLHFDTAGRHLAYAVRQAGVTHVVVDDILSDAWAGIAGIRFSAAGSSLGFVARDSRGSYSLVVNGVPGSPVERIGDFAISDDGRRWAYAAREGTRWHLVESPGERRGDTFDSVSSAAFGGSGESVRLGFVGAADSSALVFIDGRLIGRERFARDLVFSASGRRFAYVAQSGGETFVVDDRGRHAFDLVLDGSLQFDGESWGCVAGDEKRRRLFLTVDGLAAARLLDWGEITRLAQQGTEDDGLRRWVLAGLRRR